MRAVVCREFGPLESLVIEERPAPALLPGCLRVAVTACGVNYVDGLFVQGRYQIKPPLPFVPGMEVVGRVTEVASDVDGWRVGDRVFANVGLGGFVDETVVAATRCVKLPEVLSDGQAATFMQSYLTGWFALCERARVREGQSMLVLGAGSGVGLAAVDIGAALGMRVIAAASTEDKRRLATSRGALAVLDSNANADELKEQAKAFGDEVERTGGVDVIYDPVGGEGAATLLRALGENGQYVVIGFVAGIPHLPANQILLRNRRVTGVDWGAWAGRHPDENERLLAEVVREIKAGRLDPVEPVTYPLDQAVRALADLAGRKVAGKVALVP